MRAPSAVTARSTKALGECPNTSRGAPVSGARSRSEPEWSTVASHEPSGAATTGATSVLASSES
ncbi:hypothetical protein MCAG_00925 [Micromonospora sp. ATCC 39149]|nr:hypothetical protein MCAG_00925 [Micromonospora sp. ATCC 39149]